LSISAPATKLTSARLPSITLIGAAAHTIAWLARSLITGRRYLSTT
jgi:hypothetical protein